MKLMLNDTLSKEKNVYLKDLEFSQIFTDNDGDYCMKIKPEEEVSGEILTAVVLSGACIGDCLAYDEKALVTPVKAELTILEYE